jgi:hypothetical protein
MNTTNEPPVGADTVNDGSGDSSDGGGRRRLLVGGGIVAGLAVVAGIAFVLLSGGDSGAGAPVAGPGPVATNRSSARPTTVPSATPTPSAAIKTYTGKNAKDPFAPLVAEPVAAGAAGASGAAAATGSTGTATGAASGAASASGAAQKIKLVAINGTKATISIDGTKGQVAKDETFAKNYKFIALAGTCGTVQYGDVTFKLCKGQTVPVG